MSTYMRRLLPIVFAIVALAAIVPGATAATILAYPIQSIGDRGADVRAIQGFLVAHGYPVAIDGVFDATTATQVQAFQTASGLGASGIVTTATWSKLIISLTPGSTGEAVSVVQRQLNEKRFARLAVTGIYDTATRNAVKAFQKHMKLTPHGSVGPVTWNRLIRHFDYPSFHSRILCDYSVGNGKANWGTGASLGQLEAAARAFVATGRGMVAVGDVSREHGGNIALHQTHEVGMDIDIRPIRDHKNQCTWGTNWRFSSYDRAATRTLINLIRAAAPGHVKLIYFNDPVLMKEGLTTWFKGHDDHLHIRYCEPGHALKMYRC